ncbi:hypothetical protein GF351_00040 [Candidatus Woesearchaeota archaeon]|nr:hypothetical protein [Candidatus Woesearchaeota archaeon]
MRRNCQFVPFAVLVDMLFLWVYGLTSSFFTDTMMYKLTVIAEILMQDPHTPDLYMTRPGLLNLVLSNPETSALFGQFLLWAGGLAAASYLIYCIFQSLSWKFCFRIAGKEIGYQQYLKAFAKVNVLWFILFIIYSVMMILVSFRDRIGSLDYINEPAGATSSVLTVLFIVVLWLASLSYCLADKSKPVRKTFRMIMKNPGAVFSATIVIAAVFVVVDLLLRQAFSISQSMMVIAGIFIAAPLFVWQRVLLKKVVDKVR